MALRLLLIAILIGVAVRFIGKLLRALFLRPMVGTSAPRKKSNIDESQIQDADFRDL